MMVMKSWLIVIFVMLSEIAVTAHATEEPAWTLLDTQGDIELRHYAPVVQARTPTTDGFASSSKRNDCQLTRRLCEKAK